MLRCKALAWRTAATRLPAHPGCPPPTRAGRPFEARNKVGCGGGNRTPGRRQCTLTARRSLPAASACNIACSPPLSCVQAKGGAFTGDEKEYFRFVLGSRTVIPAFEEAVAGMKVRT